MSETPLPLATLIDEFSGGEWGFTGTRAGMSTFQMQMMRRILGRGQPSMFRIGGAYGADTEVYALWRKVCAKTGHVADIWPADKKRAAVFPESALVTVQEPRDPLVRNAIIVERSRFMIATPNKEHEEQRSGTWMTIRECARRNRPLLIIWPQSQKLTFYRDKKLIRVSYTVRDETVTR